MGTGHRTGDGRCGRGGQPGDSLVGQTPAPDPPATMSFMVVRAFIELVRSFTLLVPAAGALSGAACAHFSAGGGEWWRVLLGALAASVLNAGSNALNQVFDLRIDAINRPNRPLPSGRLRPGSALAFAVVLYCAGLGVGWVVSRDFFVLACAASLLTVAYSVPPVRAKRHWATAALAIALPRGLLLPVAGWASVAPVLRAHEPWWLALSFFLCVLGASATKDLGDIEGDSAGGCRTLPVVLGPVRASRVIVPFLSLPWLLLPVLPLSVRVDLRLIAGSVLFGWGLLASVRLLRNPTPGRGKAPAAWVHMYLLMLAAFAAMAGCYALTARVRI